jgi:PrtD family type I secretion system ABC transporter
MDTHAWLKPFLEPLRPLFKEVLAVSLCVNIFAMAVPVFVLQVYDRAIYHAGLSTLAGLTIGILAVIGFDFTLRRVRARILQAVALRIDVGVSQQLVEKLLTLPLRTLETRTAAQWQLLFRDADAVRNTLSGATAILVTDLVFAVLFLALVAIIAWPVFWILLVIAAVFAVIAWRSGEVVADATDREKVKIVSRDALVSELIAGRTTVKALALTTRMRNQWQTRQAATIRESLSRGTETEAFAYAGQSLSLMSTVAITAIGALAIIGHHLTIGGLIAANMLSSRLLGPMNQLIGAWRGFTLFKQSSVRLSALFAEAEEPQRSTIALDRPQGRLTLDDVTFGYTPGEAPAVSNIRLDIQPRGLTAVLGANGCGKTTLAKLILGLYRPDSGRVMIDGADIAQFGRIDLARWIGYVPQDCILFAGSIRDNIAIANMRATDAEIVKAATLARAHQMIVDLPQGYGTSVGEAGARLSGGFRQRIAIARALLGDPPFIVMDEPTSSLDRNAEDELRQSLAELARDHTIIVITHSPNLLQVCHNVVFMERGRIKAAGPTQKTLQALSESPNVRVVGGQEAKG